MSRKSKPPPPDPEPLSSLVDAHTHLAACGGRDPLAVKEILDHAQAVGVRAVVTVADDMVDARWAVSAAEWDDRAYAAVALHPTHAGDLTDDAKAELTTMAAHPRVVAVGETGLDYYWPSRSADASPIEQQHKAFRWHIDLAKQVGKPLMIHNREADKPMGASSTADLLSILADDGSPETVIMHCFSGDEAAARECVSRGYLLSFSGTVSFTNAAALQDAARAVPDELLLVETDAPYLTPHPFRGQPNQSYVLPYTLRALAQVRGQDADELATVVTRNAERAYGFQVSM